MKLSHREIILGWATLVVVIVVLTWLWFEPRFKEVKDFSTTRETSEELARRARHLLDQKDEWDARLVALRGRLPRYREDQEVAADLLRGIERIARDNEFSLLRATPGQERRVGELYEVSIDYTWEGDLQALTGFLYATQSRQVNMVIRQLNITPAPGAGQGLRGQLTVDVAYTRGPPLPGGSPQPTESPPWPEPVSEDEEDDADEDEDMADAAVDTIDAGDADMADDAVDTVDATNDGETLILDDDE